MSFLGQITNLSELIADKITGALISGATIIGGAIQGTTISGGTVTGTTVNGGTITGTTINGGTITGTTVNGATVTGTTVTGGTITGTSFRTAQAPNARVELLTTGGKVQNEIDFYNDDTEFAYPTSPQSIYMFVVPHSSTQIIMDSAQFDDTLTSLAHASSRLTLRSGTLVDPNALQDTNAELRANSINLLALEGDPLKSGTGAQMALRLNAKDNVAGLYDAVIKGTKIPFDMSSWTQVQLPDTGRVNLGRATGFGGTLAYRVLNNNFVEIIIDLTDTNGRSFATLTGSISDVTISAVGAIPAAYRPLNNKQVLVLYGGRMAMVTVATTGTITIGAIDGYGTAPTYAAGSAIIGGLTYTI